MRQGSHGQAAAGHNADKNHGKEQERLLVHVKQAEGCQCEAEKTAAGIPSVQQRISRKVVKN